MSGWTSSDEELGMTMADLDRQNSEATARLLQQMEDQLFGAAEPSPVEDAQEPPLPQHGRDAEVLAAPPPDGWMGGGSFAPPAAPATPPAHEWRDAFPYLRVVGRGLGPRAEDDHGGAVHHPAAGGAPAAATKGGDDLCAVGRPLTVHPQVETQDQKRDHDQEQEQDLAVDGCQEEVLALHVAPPPGAVEASSDTPARDAGADEPLWASPPVSPRAAMAHEAWLKLLESVWSRVVDEIADSGLLEEIAKLPPPPPEETEESEFGGPPVGEVEDAGEIRVFGFEGFAM